MDFKVGDIVKINFIPGSRYIIRQINDMFIFLDNSSGLNIFYWPSELSLHEDQIKLNRRLKNLEELI